MFDYLFFILLLIQPVLFEGRIRPQETLPKDAAAIPIETDNYSKLAGTVFLQAEGKSLSYPTYGQLYAEKILFQIPFKWMILATYFFAAILFFLNKKFVFSILLFGFFIHSLTLALRCYILLRPPVSNMSETLLYVPWVAILTGLIFHKQKAVSFASVLGACILLLFFPSHPNLETVQAVLDSQYWLIVHVLMVVGSYGIFFVAGVCGHIYLLSSSKQSEKILIQLMYGGTALLITGTLLGGFWAAQSWGRFWDWDPKESWAFISSGFYLIWIHAYRFKKIGGNGLAIGSIVGLMAITFTWYGVNYILGSGLHSYGFGNGGEKYYYLYLLLEVMFLMFLFAKINLYKNWKIEKKDRNR